MISEKAPIERCMSSVLVVIQADQTLQEAVRLMRAHQVRHLPVLEEGRVVGMLSQRDVHLIESLPGVDPALVRVREAMVRELYTVEPDEPLERVVRVMAQRKIGSALVTHNERLVGLFTTTDALLVLAAVLREPGVAGLPSSEPPSEPAPEVG